VVSISIRHPGEEIDALWVAEYLTGPPPARTTVRGNGVRHPPSSKKEKKIGAAA